jgi:ATP-binding cassette subfamily B (MDR/TAP) protein 1
LFSAYAASLYYGATRVAAGSMSGGDVLAVMMAALLGAYSLGQAAPLLQFFLAGRSAAGRLTAIDKLQPGIDVNAEGLVPAEVAGELRLQGVSFVYPSLRVQVLDQLDLHIPAGEFGGCVACLGSTGGLASQWNALLQSYCKDPANDGCKATGATCVTKFDQVGGTQGGGS